MDYKEFVEWQAFYSIEPFGHKREDFQAALIGSILANANRGKAGKEYTINDFLLDFSKPDPDAKVKKMIAVMNTLVARTSGK